MSNRLISMSDATRLCSYDQEYLSLLARRGILKAKKVSGKWYTTVSWLNEYIAQKRPNELIEASSVKALGLQTSLISAGNIARLLLFTMLMIGSLVISYWLANFYSDMRSGGDTASQIQGSLGSPAKNLNQGQAK